VNRLSERVVASLHSSGLHLELIADMKRLNSLFCASAYPVLDAAAASADAAAAAERVSAEVPADAAAIPPAQTP
jgi:phosphate:Na+ symporter